MMEQLKAAYANYRWARLVVGVGLLICGILLYWLSGGFPPWAWRFLASVLPQISHLWAVQGARMVIPLAGLVLLSITLFILWGGLLGFAIKLAWDWWDAVQERRRFALDLQEAEDMAEALLEEREQEEYERQQRLAANWQPQRPQPARRVRYDPPTPQEIAAPVRPAFVNDTDPGVVNDSDPEFEDDSAFFVDERFSAYDPGVTQRPTTKIVRDAGTVSRASAKRAEPFTRSRPSRPTRNLQGGRVEQPTRSLQDERAEREVSRRRAVGEVERAERTQRVEKPNYDGIIWSINTDESVSDVSSFGSVNTDESVDDVSSFRSSEVRGQMTNSAISRAPQKQRPAYSQSLPAPARQLLANAAPHASLRGQFRLMPQIIEDERVRKVYGAYDTLPYLDLDSAQDIDRVSTQPGDHTSGKRQLETDSLTENKPLRLVIGIGLDPGIVRKDAPNEDNLFAIQGMRAGHDGQEPVGLFVVADGMGGHANGQMASRMAIQAISDVVAPVLLQQADEDETLADLLKEGVHRANLAIYKKNEQQERMMGTTLTAALVVGPTAYIANVGDSRTYLYRPSEGLRQVTRDHSVVARLVEDGVITREEIYTHPKRNQIYLCLGEKPAVQLDSFEETLQVGDILILCSDGLWEMVRDNDLEKIVAAGAPHASQISAMLVQGALSRGGADNISVVVVTVLHEE